MDSSIPARTDQKISLWMHLDILVYDDSCRKAQCGERVKHQDVEDCKLRRVTSRHESPVENQNLTPVNIAVVGAGYWGRKVMREVQGISLEESSVTLRYVVDNSPSALGECQREFGPLECRLDYQSLLSDPDLHAVHIATPNNSHFEVASAFIKAGKHVLVEKPLALKSTEAYQLTRLAQENEVVLCVGHIHRFNNGVSELRRALSTGVLGSPYYLRLEWTGFLPPQASRDVITDLAPHPFDICNYLTGRWPVKISCRARGYRTPDNEEMAFISCEYEDGLYSQIEVSWLDWTKRRNLTLVAKDGIATLDCVEQKAFLQRKDRTEQVPIVPSNTLRAEIQHFANCINNQKLSRPYSNDSDGMLGANVVTCLQAARESLTEERTVRVQFPISKETAVLQ